jgi:hypothetical protein
MKAGYVQNDDQLADPSQRAQLENHQATRW